MISKKIDYKKNSVIYWVKYLWSVIQAGYELLSSLSNSIRIYVFHYFNNYLKNISMFDWQVS